MSASLPEAEGVVPATEPVWLHPGDALARVQAVIPSRKMAIDTMLGRLGAGALRGTYKTFKWENISTKRNLDPNFVTPNHWRRYSNYHESEYVWTTGDLKLFLGSVEGSITETNVYLTYFQVRLDRAGIDQIVANTPTPPKRRSPWIKRPPPPQPAPQPSPQINKGGAPRKEWWDDFWIEICRQIWIGDLKPRTQADLERAMFEWVENRRDATVGETTVKGAARKLFTAWKLRSKT